MSWTPPQSTVLLLAGTPVHTHSSTTDHFAPKYEDRDTTLRQLSDEMSSFFVGPMPPQDFLDTFLPSTSLNPSVLPFERGMFSPSNEMALEPEMYDKFVKIVGSHLPKLDLVNTSRKQDKAPYTKFAFSCRPDCSVYSSGSNHNHELNLSLVEFPIKFKTTTDQDPFVADPEMSTSYHQTSVLASVTHL
ncbi:hypothetical protein EDB83DRAFT_2319184 [Lactarius deliciosus]|nr:hypothetical protein EDB83DRAFT_2319184 [Lactarius deliciosus]